jgi:hypothetical protein
MLCEAYHHAMRGISSYVSLKVALVIYDAARCAFGTQARNIPSTGSPTENRGQDVDWSVIGGKRRWNVSIKCRICKIGKG